MARSSLNRLKVLRAERDMSQAELAALVGISRQALNAIENRRHDPSVTLALKIARALGAPLEAAFQLPED